MLQRFVNLLKDKNPAPAASASDRDPVAPAAAALLVEAGCHDGNFGADERYAIVQICQRHFDLDEKSAEELVADAEEEFRRGSGLQPYTQIVKEHYDEAERVKIIEMLWEVAYADGELHDYEANLLRRVGGLLYVSERDRGNARKRVMQRLGIEK